MRQLSFLKIGGGGDIPTLEELLIDNWYENLIREQNSENHEKSPTRIERFDPQDQWTGHYIEPHPYHLIQLIKRMAKSHKPDKYKIYQCCIKSLPRFQPFWMRGNDIESISVISGLYPDSRAQFYAPVFKLQEFLSAVEIKPDYINMNIEGSEEVLIENYDFKHKPDTWAIETHRDMTSPWKIASILEKNGYSTILKPSDANDPHTMVIAYLK